MNKRQNPGGWVLLAIVGLLLAIGIGRVVWALTPYNSEWAWRLQALLHHKEIPYTHNNIYTDGIDGILEDIRARLDLPETLYISNAQTIDYNVDGTVTGIDLLLYGLDADGNPTGTWLVSYEEGDEKMTVITGGALGAETSADAGRDSMLLQPMQDLLAAMDLSAISADYAACYECNSLQLVYWGYRGMTINEETYMVSQDGGITMLTTYNSTHAGYEVSIHDPDDDGATPARYFAEWLTSQNYVAPEVTAAQEAQAAADEQRTDPDQLGTGYLDNTDGTMYCYISDEIGYRLVVADAAAGSRYYQLEKTTDGGITWALQNEDPFLGRIGVVGGMTWTDELHGEIRLDSPSGGVKEICRTEDGGVTFVASDEQDE